MWSMCLQAAEMLDSPGAWRLLIFIPNLLLRISLEVLVSVSLKKEFSQLLTKRPVVPFCFTKVTSSECGKGRLLPA